MWVGVVLGLGVTVHVGDGVLVGLTVLVEICEGVVVCVAVGLIVTSILQPDRIQMTGNR